MNHPVYHTRITETLSPHSYEVVWILQKELINSIYFVKASNNWGFERNLAWVSAELFHKNPLNIQVENLMLAL